MATDWKTRIGKKASCRSQERWRAKLFRVLWNPQSVLDHDRRHRKSAKARRSPYTEAPCSTACRGCHTHPWFALYLDRCSAKDRSQRQPCRNRYVLRLCCSVRWGLGELKLRNPDSLQASIQKLGTQRSEASLWNWQLQAAVEPYWARTLLPPFCLQGREVT